MKEILQTIIENLVDDKTAIEIKEIAGERTTVFEVKVAEADMGKVIGRKGIIATSIRNVMQAAASREKKKVSVEFIG